MKNFKELHVWQKGMDIAVNCIKIANDFPQHVKFSLGTQLTKAGVSIPSNVAEGSSRSSGKDYARFVEISLGSANEIETQLLIAQRASVGNQALIDETLVDVDQEQKMLMSFLSKLKQ